MEQEIDHVHAAGAVHCRDCKYYYKYSKNGNTIRACMHPELYSAMGQYDDIWLEMSETDFCSRGEAI